MTRTQTLLQQPINSAAVTGDRLPITQPNMPAHQTVTERERPAPKLYPPKIAKAILAVTRAAGPVAKAGKNTFHKYAYAKWEDILDEIATLIADNGLIIQQSEIGHGGVNSRMIEITYEFTIINEDGDVWPDRPTMTQICKIEDGKGTLDDKASSKCFTTAQKYMHMSLFKIRTADMAEADHDGDQQTKKRAVPSADGSIKPHTVPILKDRATGEGETPVVWSQRFIAFINKAKSVEEIEAWEKANDKTLDLIEGLDAKNNTTVMATIVDAMTVKINEFKGETTTKATATPAKTETEFNPEEWLTELQNAFSGCEDLSSLADQQERRMVPFKEKVTPVIWQQAGSIAAEHAKRIQEGA